MFGFLLAILVLDGFLLGLVVLMQSGKGDGLAAMGGSGSTMADSVLGGRQAVTLLTKTTWVTGAIFLGLSLVLSVMSSRASNATSILQDTFNEAPTPGQPLIPTVPGATGAGAAEGAASGAATANPDTSQ
ncbi:MAG: preprotein translocase subunit SecG [Gemmatimonadota bacterium]